MDWADEIERRHHYWVSSPSVLWHIVYERRLLIDLTDSDPPSAANGLKQTPTAPPTSMMSTLVPAGKAPCSPATAPLPSSPPTVPPNHPPVPAPPPTLTHPPIPTLTNLGS